MSFFKNSRILLSCCVAIACLVLVAFLRKPPKNTDYFRFYCEKILNKKKYDIVVFGNSRSQENINYNIIQSYLPNARIFNFGWGGGGYLHPSIIKHGMRFLDPNGKRVFVYFLDYVFLQKKKNDFYCLLSLLTSLTKDIDVIIKAIFFLKSNYRVYCRPIEYYDENFYIFRTKESHLNISPKINVHDNCADFIQNIQFLKRNHIDCIVLHAPTCPRYREIEHTWFESIHLREMVENAGYRWLEQPKSLYLSMRPLGNQHVDIESGERFAHWFGKQLAKMLR